MLYSSAAHGKVVMCDPPVCEHRFRSCHTVYFILSMDHGRHICYWTIPSFVEPLLLANLPWRALSRCRRTSVRPPDDRKSLSHTDYTAPCHCQATLLSKLLQSSLNCIFSSAPFFSTGPPPSHISREYGKQRTLAIIQ